MRDRLLTVAQAAQLAGVMPSTVRTWLQRGHIRRVHGGAISSRQLTAWMDRRDEVMVSLRRRSSP